MTAAEAYAARIDAVNAQRARLYGGLEPPGMRWGRDAAERFSYDPHRGLDANLDTIASYIQPEDVLIDVGGGAGRICLPMALRCREGVVVDGSPAMGEVFREVAAAAGITNARFVHQEWLEADAIDGDVAFAASVTYFVQNIVGFVEKMIATARRRVMITLRSVTGPNQSDGIFRVLHGEEQEQSPGYRELLPVLWEMGILPDVRVLPVVRWGPANPGDARWPRTREGAVEMAMQNRRVWAEDTDRARGRIEAHFDELFAGSPDGFRPLWHRESRELLITWRTDQSPCQNT